MQFYTHVYKKYISRSAAIIPFPNQAAAHRAGSGPSTATPKTPVASLRHRSAVARWAAACCEAPAAPWGISKGEKLHGSLVS